MGVMGTLSIILALAFLAETLVEAIFGRLMDHIPALQSFKWALVYIAIIVGIIGAFVYQFDLIYLLGQFLESPVQQTMFGIIITGIAIGMGSAYIHQFISRFFPQKNEVTG